jgi:hypothetical protein
MSTIFETVKNSASAPTRGLRKKLPQAIRAALEKVIKYWIKNIAPKHFKRSAFGNYSEYALHHKKNYEKWKKKYGWKERKGYDTALPLVKTGELRRAFLRGSYIFTGSNEDVKTKWTGLPKHAYYSRAGHGRALNKSPLLVAYCNSEYDLLLKHFDIFLGKELEKIDPASRTYGRAVL